MRTSVTIYESHVTARGTCREGQRNNDRAMLKDYRYWFNLLERIQKSLEMMRNPKFHQKSKTSRQHISR